MPGEKAYKISEIIRLPEFQIRDINDDYILDLNENLDHLPPVIIYDITDKDFGGPVLIAGHHRVLVREKAGQDHVYAIRKSGTRNQALEESIHSNATHGLGLSQKEKTNAVKLLLKMNNERNNSWIGEIAGVSDKTVKKIRDSLELNGDIEIVDTFKTRDGKNIGTTKKSTMDSGYVNLRVVINCASEDQRELIESALDKGAKECGSHKRCRVLELICADFLSGGDISKFEHTDELDLNKFTVDMSDNAFNTIK